MMEVVLGVVVYAFIAGAAAIGCYHVGYGNGYNDAMKENQEEHYLTD